MSSKIRRPKLSLSTVTTRFSSSGDLNLSTDDSSISSGFSLFGINTDNEEKMHAHTNIPPVNPNIKIAHSRMNSQTIIGTILAFLSCCCGLIALKDVRFCWCYKDVCKNCDFEAENLPQRISVFQYCDFNNCFINDKEILDSKIIHSEVSNSKLIATPCEQSSISNSSIQDMGGSGCLDCKIYNSTVESTKIIGSKVYYSDLSFTHLLNSNIYEGNCQKCEVEKCKVVSLDLDFAFVYNSECVSNTTCTHCCIYDSKVEDMKLSNSLYHNLKNDYGFIDRYKSEESGKALVCPWFNEKFYKSKHEDRKNDGKKEKIGMDRIVFEKLGSIIS